jgi:hypothetical protein
MSGRRSASIWLALSLALIVVFALSPLVVAIGAGMFGASMGCRVDEGGSYPCPVLGYDAGTLLEEMFVSGWFVFLTLPIGATAALVWLVVAVAIFVRRERK